MSFASRPPSTGWEPLSLPEATGWPVWAWFRPADAQDGFLVQIPPETLQACGRLLTLRRLTAAAGLPVELVATWALQGSVYDAWQGANPLVDHPVPFVSPAGETIVVRARPEALMPLATAVANPVAGFTPRDASRAAAGSAYDAIDADWNALLQIETQLGLVRKQLNGLQSRLASLNRDLSPDERVASDNLDKKDWQDARRWLRDSLAQVSRCIRDHDIGSTSAAGNRNRFEQLYNEVIVPRRPHENLAGLQKEFEIYRKTAQTLLSHMQNAHAAAARDGEQRAQQLLTRIAAKVRAARTKKGRP